MKERLIKLMNYMGLNATAFSGEIGVQRSSISHIMSGRNLPSLDFLTKITKRFPQVNPEWLLNGYGSMLKPDPQNNGNASFTEKTLFAGSTSENDLRKENNNTTNTKSESGILNEFTDVNSIEKVIILYKNGTFSDYRPK